MTEIRNFAFQLGMTNEDETKRRVAAGWQCPECFGPFISKLVSRFEAQPVGFICDDCGCQFGSK